MNDNKALLLLRQSAEAIVIRHDNVKESIQSILATRLFNCLDELAADYIAHSQHLHCRTRAVTARICLETAVRIQASLQSQEYAVLIAYFSAREDLKGAKQLTEIDPQPPAIVADLVSSLVQEVSTLEGLLTVPPPKKLSIFDIAKFSNCLRVYRSHYFNLSQYIHSSYSTASIAAESTAIQIADESVLLSLCISSEVIAGFFSHSDFENIKHFSRAFWNDRNMEAA